MKSLFTSNIWNNLHCCTSEVWYPRTRMFLKFLAGAHICPWSQTACLCTWCGQLSTSFSDARWKQKYYFQSEIQHCFSPVGLLLKLLPNWRFRALNNGFFFLIKKKKQNKTLLVKFKGLRLFKVVKLHFRWVKGSRGFSLRSIFRIESEFWLFLYLFRSRFFSSEEIPLLYLKT